MLQPPSIILQALSLSDLFSWIYLSPPLYNHKEFQFSSIQLLSRVQFFVIPWTAACQDSCPSPTPGVCSNSCPSSWWCHPTISSSVIPFSSCPQPSPASWSFPMSWLFAPGGRITGASASASVLPVKIQGWFPLGLTGLISLLSKGLTRVLQHDHWKASILWRSAFSVVQLSHLFMTTAETIALTIWTFVSKVRSVLFNNCLGLSLLFFQEADIL